jgi:hypothetical protein
VRIDGAVFVSIDCSVCDHRQSSVCELILQNLFSEVMTVIPDHRETSLA